MRSQRRSRYAIAAIAALMQWLLIAPANASIELAARNPAYFEREIRAFEATDRRSPPKPGGIVFTGSSSIRFWPELREAMALYRRHGTPWLETTYSSVEEISSTIMHRLELNRSDAVR